MYDYTKMTAAELKAEFEKISAEYKKMCDLNLSLDMSRGKPGFDDTELSEKMLTSVSAETGYKNKEGIDCRNYGGIDGILEMKELFADILGLKPENIIAAGNSSLNLMFDTVSQGITHGLGGAPWSECKNRKFLCPVPGYDRHFAVTDYFGFELIPIEMDENGPDMDKIEEYVKDESVKGIWCVPKYSNPEGTTYSDETVKRFAALKPAAKDFHIFWDNAYVVHDLYDETDPLLNIYDECVKNGTEDMVIIFASTSKISIPGDGVSVVAGSKNTVDMLKGRLKFQTVGPDKLNMLRHARMFPDFETLKNHMKKHAVLLRPKFEAVLEAFNKELEGKGIARWTKPRGGYFISLYVMDGCAKRVYELCANAGLVLTPAGASYPHGNDPHDSHLRIAPTYPTLENMKKASEVLCVAVKYAAAEKLLNS